MKRLNSSDSLGAFICPSTDENSPRNNIYSKEFQSMLDGYDEEVCLEESVHVSEKKRRLSVDQVKALEKNFEVENKLEPERKVKLAQELGLQPRQVAVWFQNRRARWKTKQLERDYGILKANYDSLKLNFDALHHDNDSLVQEIKELKAKVNEENPESNLSIKEEKIILDPDQTSPERHDHPPATSLPAPETKELNYETFNRNGSEGVTEIGNSDSDSSAILNEDNSPTAAISSSENLQTNQISSPAAINCFQFQKTYHYVKMEEHNFFSGDEDCNFFSDEQAPTLQWYCPEEWN